MKQWWVTSGEQRWLSSRERRSLPVGLPVHAKLFHLGHGGSYGSNEGARITVAGDPKLPKDQWTFDRTFRTEVFKRTAPRDFRNAGIGLLRGPGIENYDISVTKRFPVTQQRYFWFRAEFFNAFNHTQFSGISTAARFDSAGNQINLNFGAYTSARAPRRIQLSLRFMY